MRISRLLDAAIALIIALLFGLLIFWPVHSLVMMASAKVNPPAVHKVMPIGEALLSGLLTLLLSAGCFYIVRRVQRRQSNSHRPY